MSPMVPGFMAASRLAVSALVNTTGNRSAGWRVPPKTRPVQCATLSGKRKTSAFNAWFCVEAATFPRTAKSVRNASISVAPISFGCRLP